MTETRKLKKKVRDERKSLWQHFNPSVGEALDELNLWASQIDSKQMVLGIFRLENMASIIYSYGEEVALSSTDKITEVIQLCLGNETKVIRVGIEDFLYACKLDDIDSHKKRIDEIFSSLIKYGASLTTTPVFFLFSSGSVAFDVGDSIEARLDQAFIALYESKNSATRHVLFNEASEALLKYKEQMETSAKLQRAMIDKKLRLAYQPIIKTLNGEVESYEALLRILDANGEFITAARLIPIAEDFGYIEDVDLIVFDLVFHELELNDKVVIAVNVSSVSAIQSKWLELAVSKLSKRPDIAKRLIVEITETGLHRDINKIIKFVDTVKALGAKVAIDDFGAGYTSFSQLKHLQVDIIKIDGAFIKDLVDNPDSQLFVETLQKFAKAFCLETVAEFVENGEIAKKLMAMGVDLLQGYYFNKPLNCRPWIKDDRVM